MAPKCSALYHKPCVTAFLPLSNAIRFYALKSNPRLNSETRSRAQTKYLLSRAFIGADVFVVLPSVWRKKLRKYKKIDAYVLLGHFIFIFIFTFYRQKVKKYSCEKRRTLAAV